MIESKNDETRLIVRFRDHLESEEFVGKRAFTLINDNDLEEEAKKLATAIISTTLEPSALKSYFNDYLAGYSKVYAHKFAVKRSCLRSFLEFFEERLEFFEERLEVLKKDTTFKDETILANVETVKSSLIIAVKHYEAVNEKCASEGTYAPDTLYYFECYPKFIFDTNLVIDFVKKEEGVPENCFNTAELIKVSRIEEYNKKDDILIGGKKLSGITNAKLSIEPFYIKDVFFSEVTSYGGLGESSGSIDAHKLSITLKGHSIDPEKQSAIWYLTLIFDVSKNGIPYDKSQDSFDVFTNFIIDNYNLEGKDDVNIELKLTETILEESSTIDKSDSLFDVVPEAIVNSCHLYQVQKENPYTCISFDRQQVANITEYNRCVIQYNLPELFLKKADVD